MANFTRVKPAGWSLNEILTSAQQNQLDIDHTKAPNFDEGSSHSPASQVVLGGAGFNLTGPFDLEGSANLGPSVDVTWNNALGDTTTARTMSIEARGGTGANDGVGLQAYGQPGQAQSGANPNNDGGPCEVGGGAPGTGGSGGAGEYGPFNVRHGANAKTKTYHRRFTVSGTGTVTDAWLDPEGDIAAGECVALRVRTCSIAQSTPTGSGSAHYEEWEGIVSRDSASAMYGASVSQGGAGNASYSVTLAFTNNGQTVAIDVTGDNAGDKTVHMVVEAMRLAK